MKDNQRFADTWQLARSLFPHWVGFIRRAVVRLPIWQRSMPARSLRKKTWMSLNPDANEADAQPDRRSRRRADA